MSTVLPLLVTGISGVAGYNAFHHFRRRYSGQVFGIRPHQTSQLTGEGIIPLDAEDRPGLRELFNTFRFRSVLNCIGNCALKSCELDPGMARTLNVVTAVTIAECVQAHGCRLVHLSSDLVFSGAAPTRPYIETDLPDPVTIYGKTMAEAERLIAGEVPGAAILRISLPMGPSFNRHAGAIDWIRSRFRAGRPATLYYDEVRSCTYVDDLNTVFEHFLTRDEAGLFHAGGPRSVSLYQIGQIVNRVGGHDPHLLKGCPRIEAGPMPPRAGNVSMDSSKLLRLLGSNPFRPWPLTLELMPSSRLWHFHRADGPEGSFRHVIEHLYSYPESGSHVAAFAVE
jgi:dTDP-4-dehydrorhamnose reductase